MDAVGMKAVHQMKIYYGVVRTFQELNHWITKSKNEISKATQYLNY